MSNLSERPSGSQESQTIEKRANYMRLLIIFGFIGGSTLAALVFFQSHYLGFLLPALISIVLFWISLKTHLKITKGLSRV